MIVITEVVNSVAFQTTLTLRDPENSRKHDHTRTLNEVQRRAYQIHQRHGAIHGGYTLEDWLEAEHELDDEDNPSLPKKDQVH